MRHCAHRFHPPRNHPLTGAKLGFSSLATSCCQSCCGCGCSWFVSSPAELLRHHISQSIMHPLHATPAQQSSMHPPSSSPPPGGNLLLLLLPPLFPLLASSVATAAIEPTGWSFFTIGDWGSGKQNQSQVAATMGIWGELHQPHFVVALGDNIYEDGVESVADPLWTSRYCSVYTDPSLLDIPWYAILGNHDYYSGHPEAQIEYYRERLDPAQRWVMPDHYYTYSWPDVGGGRSLQLVFLDTIQLADDTYRRVLREDVDGGQAPTRALRQLEEWTEEGEGGKEEEGEEVFPKGLRRTGTEKEEKEGWGGGGVSVAAARARDKKKKKKQAQLEWLEATLAASTADWLLVAGHFPVYSAGYHGDTPELQRDVRPLLQKYNVDAYLCGHDHDLEYLLDAPEGEGVSYFVSGSGGQDIYGVRKTKETVFAVAESGFMHHAFVKDGSEMRVDVVNRDGQVLLSKTLRQKRELTVGGVVGGGRTGVGMVKGEDAVIMEMKHRP